MPEMKEKEEKNPKRQPCQRRYLKRTKPTFVSRHESRSKKKEQQKIMAKD